MIAKEAVEAFLKRPRRSWTKYKRWTRVEILAELDALGVPRKFKTTPRKHQLVGYLVGHLNHKFLYFFDPGLGKSKVVLDLFRLARHENPDIQALVFVPKKVHMGTWQEQVEVHSEFSITVCDATSIEEKWETLESSTADVTVIDYAGFVLACTRKAKVAGRIKRVRDDSKTLALRRKYHYLALDEVHRCKNQDTTRFGAMRQLSKDAEYLYGLTGTPQGRDPQALWSQFFLVDRGHTLGETLGLMRAAFFDEKKNYWGGFDHKFKEEMMPLLSSFIQHASLTYTEDECLDLPAVLDVPRKFRMTPEQRDVYAKLRAGKFIEEVRVPIDGVFHRMRECTSGYQRVKVNGVSVVQHFKDNPKRDMLEDDVATMVSKGNKGMVFYDYKPTGDLISAMLKDNGIKHLRLDGATKDSISVESQFRKDERISILLANTGSGSEGINAQAANYLFFYESPTSPIARIQAVRRAKRMGQRKRVLVFDYLANNSVDANIQAFLAEGIDMLAALKRGGGAVQRALLEGKG